MSNIYTDPTTGEWVGEHETTHLDGTDHRHTEWFATESEARAFASGGNLDTFKAEHLTAWELDPAWSYTWPENAETFPSLPAMRAAVVSSGSHYFDPDTVGFFRGKTHNTFRSGRFFIDSIHPDDAAPTYRVGWFYRAPTTDMLQHGRLASDFPTLLDARHAAAQLARLVEGVTAS